MPARLAAVGALALILLVSACGGQEDPAKQAQGVVKDFAKAVNDRDGKTFCHDLVTRSYLEQITLAKGKSAESQCERQIDTLRLQQKYKVVKFDKTKIDGDKATVTAVLQVERLRRPQVFRLRKEDGKFRLTSGATE
jgi:hypothetical protein